MQWRRRPQEGTPDDAGCTRKEHPLHPIMGLCTTTGTTPAGRVPLTRSQHHKDAGSRHALPGAALPGLALGVALLALLVVLLAAVAGMARRNAYQTDLHAAEQAATAAHCDSLLDVQDASRCAGAVADYTAAINDWPFHSEAQVGLEAVQSRVAAVALRLSVYQSYELRRQQVAQQTDTSADATATAVAQAEVAAVAQATSSARARATAAHTAHATATAVAVAMSTSQAALGTGGVSGVVRVVLPSIVRVTADIDATSGRVGTGVVIASDGSGSYILTNNHVVENTIHVTIQAQGSGPFPVTSLAQNADADLAVLHISTTLPPAQWGDSKALSIGQAVLAIGYAEGLNGSPTVTSGILSATGRQDDAGHTFLQHTAPINPGNSGGPLLDLQGHVLGINTFTLQDTQGLFFAIPADRARTVAGTLMSQIHG